jgi:hypothetical protein
MKVLQVLVSCGVWCVDIGSRRGLIAAIGGLVE